MDSGDRTSIYRNIILITQISLYVMVPIFLCLGAGIWLDGKFGWSTTLPLMALGIAAGARTGYVEVKKVIVADEEKRKKKQLEEIEDKVKRHGKT